jgi:hypothetical protein
MKQFLIFIVLLLFLSGCGIKEGTVCDKKYTAPYYSTNMVLCGKTWIPQTIYHNAEWTITIKRYNMAKGKYEYGWCEVSEKDYSSIKIGQYIKFD